MSQLQHWLGAVATSSGFWAAGWVAWRRRSRTSPLARSNLYMVATLARYVPSSRNLAYTVAGASSTWPSWWSTSSTAWRSGSDRA